MRNRGDTPYGVPLLRTASKQPSSLPLALNSSRGPKVPRYLNFISTFFVGDAETKTLLEMVFQKTTTDRDRPAPRIVTNLERPSAAYPESARRLASPSAPERPATGLSPAADASSAPAEQVYRPFVLTDPLAFLYLSEDSCTTVLEHRKQLQGYECYIVEQWSTSRSHPTFTITTYTGDPSHEVVVGVLGVPADESTWSTRLRVYFEALNQHHAKRRETDLGVLMVTNLSEFPSGLTVIHVPDGDLRKHRFDFFVNENLKRLGCSGRVGLTLSPPSASTVINFHNRYCTSEKNDIYPCVIELVKLCQSALMLFDKLKNDYADGLLCDMTERAINAWWLETGSDIYNTEPHDGILGPMTVAGLLGLLMGCRNRLHAAGASVGKDAFDVEATKRGIAAFQKQNHIRRTRRLDRQTLERLRRVTFKAANNDGWVVSKAVKSTVAELSGKAGEMVMDVAGRRDRAGIAEVETCDIDRFVQLLYGERCKWLWHGRPLKQSGHAESVDGVGAPKLDDDTRIRPTKHFSFRQDDHGGFMWTTRKTTGDILTLQGRDAPDDVASPRMHLDGQDDNNIPKSRLPFRKKTGLGRLKGAVGRRSCHAPEPQNPGSVSPSSQKSPRSRKSALLRYTQGPYASVPVSPVDGRSSSSIHGGPDRETGPAEADARHPTVIVQSASQNAWQSLPPSPILGESLKQNRVDTASETGSDTDGSPGYSITGSVFNGVPPEKVLPTLVSGSDLNVDRLVQRTSSFSRFIAKTLETKNEESFPRHLSFSLAESSVLKWEDVFSDDADEDAVASDLSNLARVAATQSLCTLHTKSLQTAIHVLETDASDWTDAQLSDLDNLLDTSRESQDAIDALYGPLAQSLQELQASREEVVQSAREELHDGEREMETLAARLEYEIDLLKGKVEEVEAGVGDFEKGVARVEDRVNGLTKVETMQGRPGWCGIM